MLESCHLFIFQSLYPICDALTTLTLLHFQRYLFRIIFNSRIEMPLPIYLYTSSNCFFYSGCLLDINFKGNLKYDNRYLPTDTTLVLHSFYLGCGKMGHFKLPCGIFPYIYGRGILTWINISTLNTLMEFYMIFTEYYYYFDGMLYIFHFSFFRIIRYSTI